MFAKWGYYQTTIADIADKAGISQPYVFRFFATMEGFGPFPALANGNFVIINHDEHSEEEEIVEAFYSF